MKPTTTLKRTVTIAALCALLIGNNANAEVTPRIIKSQLRTSNVVFDRSFVDSSFSLPKPNIAPPPSAGHDPAPNVQPPIALILAAGSKSALDSDDDGCDGGGDGLCASAGGKSPAQGNFYIQEFSMFYVVGSGIRLPDDVAEF